MKLCTYRFDDGIRAAIVGEHSIYDVLALRKDLPLDLASLLGMGSDVLHALQALRHQSDVAPLERQRFLSPIPHPRIFLAAGLNYKDHAAEMHRPLGTVPSLFAKLRGAEAPPFSVVPRSCRMDSLDYEGELGFVVGAPCYQLNDEDPATYIGGYFIVNDFSTRALVRPETLVLAKGGANFGPFGPWLTTPDEVGDPHSLRIRSWVNEDLRQDSNTCHMHFDCYQLLHIISQSVALLPGDIITTGSPAGTGMSFDPPRYLQPGDVVRVEIDKLGYIENVIASAS